MTGERTTESVEQELERKLEEAQARRMAAVRQSIDEWRAEAEMDEAREAEHAEAALTDPKKLAEASGPDRPSAPAAPLSGQRRRRR